MIIPVTEVLNITKKWNVVTLSDTLSCHSRAVLGKLQENQESTVKMFAW